MFTTHFAGSRLHQTTTLSILSIRQEQEETLRAFIDRFRKVILHTLNLNQEMILQCMALTLNARTQAPCRGLHLHGRNVEPQHQVLQCKALQDKIKDLVRAGHFRRFLRKDGPPHPSWSDNRHPPRNT